MRQRQLLLMHPGQLRKLALRMVEVILKKNSTGWMPRRSRFASSDRDQEVSQWRDWYWGLRQYLLAVDGRYEEHRQDVERPDINEVDRDLLDDDD